MVRRESPGVDMPLLDWGEQLRAEKRRRRTLGLRAAIVVAGIVLISLTIAIPPAPRFVWNTSASAPIGLYQIESGMMAEAGDMAVAWVPGTWRTLAAKRRYIPANVPLVKHVAATAGDEVCALRQDIFINGQWAAQRSAADASGRPIPWWRGCTTLRGTQIFLLMADREASFDGRYFGVSEGDLVVGKARLLWAR